MSRKTLRDIEIAERRLLVRVDFNVPLREQGGIAGDRRIRASLPTLRHCLERDAALVLMTHLGRPGGRPDPRLSVAVVADRLRELLGGISVHCANDVVGEDARRRVEGLRPKEVLLLENLRFDPGEREGGEAFARRLREFGEIYVNDAFAACHRQHASMLAVPRQFPKGHRVMGLLLEHELDVLDRLLVSPPEPMVAVLGGVKVAGKLGAAEALLDRVDTLLVGGAMAFTFMKARGLETGDSPVDEDSLERARRLLQRAGDRIVLPLDHLAARSGDDSAEAREVGESIPAGWCGFDIGPRTIDRFREKLAGAAAIVWNGPLGMFEREPFGKGTEAIARCMADSDALTVLGGGETGEAVEQMQLAERMDHVSTGGGAFLAYLEQGSLPALSVLNEEG